MSYSTRLAAHGWKFEDISNADLALFLRISPGDAAARRTTLAAQQQDPAWIAQTLESLPAATLAVLHLIVDAGGMAFERELIVAAEAEFGMSAPDVRAAVSAAVGRVLAVPLRTHGNEVAVSVVLPAGMLIAPLLADLDLYELSASAFVAEDSPVRNPRMFLAACTATRHMDMKLTAEHRPHRGATKRLAKQVGIDERVLELMLGHAYDLHLLVLDGELLRPDIAALTEVAAGNYARLPAIAGARDRVGRAPVAVAALQRSVTRELGYFNVDVLEYLPGFELGRTDGVPACTWRVLDGAASGHVTPSFEVMLPPESRPVDIVAVGACCEWERLDRALVARITKASIARAVAGGAKAGDILAQLAAVSRHPIPQNVEAAIRDWAGSVVAATIATGHVVMVEPSERARVAPLLTDLAAQELAPGVFLVRDHELRDITRVLGRAGVMHRDLEALPWTEPMPSRAASSPAKGAAASQRALEWPGLEPADGASGAAASSARGQVVGASGSAAASPASSPEAARMRARVGAWRRGEPFEGRRDDFLETLHAKRAREAVAPASKKPVVPRPAPGTTSARFDRWLTKMQLAVDLDDPAIAGMRSIVESLSDEDARGLLDASRTLEQLARGLARIALKRETSPGKAAASTTVPLNLAWRREDVRGRLQFAAKRREALALALPSEVRFVNIAQVIRRGTIWMVLGEDLIDGEAIAVPVPTIEAFAELGDEALDRLMGFDDDELVDVGVEPDAPAAAVRRPWRPVPGQPPPAGHLPCPCGSGERYRNCCRNAPMA